MVYVHCVRLDTKKKKQKTFLNGVSSRCDVGASMTMDGSFQVTVGKSLSLHG